MSDPTTTPRPMPATARAWEPFPQIDLRQLLALSDDTGIFQHAQYAVPDPHHGYCIDDNARALIASLLHAQLRDYDERVVPIQRYLAFLVYAFNPDTRRFRNFMGYDRRWLEEVGSEDSQGRTIWALGLTVQLAPTNSMRDLARDLLLRALSTVPELTFLRSRAFVLLGLDAYLAYEHHDEAASLRNRLANGLFDAWKKHARDDWPWWEDVVTYDNAKLPHAMLLAGQAMGRSDMIDAALRALNWLLDVQTAPAEAGGHLSIIGNQGWLKRGEQRAAFDQQPLEAYAMLDACLIAADMTGDGAWADHAWRCFEWFHGRNDLNVPVYHEQTGGCQDGLNANGPNANQGAESSLAYLISVLELHRYREAKRGRVSVRAPQTLNLAIIGAGRRASLGLEAFARVPGLAPVTVWSRTADRAQQLAAPRELDVAGSFDAVLDDPRVHVVYLAVPPDAQAEHAVAALRRGKHVVCETPLAPSLVHVQEMLQAATERDRSIGVHLPMRFAPLAEPVRELIASNLLGALRRADCAQSTADDEPGNDWRADEARSGGLFAAHGTGAIDLFRSWLGDAVVEYAARIRRPADERVDQALCELRHAGHISVGYYLGLLGRAATQTQTLRLFFERGQVTLVGSALGSLHAEATFDDAGLDRLRQLLPGATVESFAGRDGEGRHAVSRDGAATLHRHVAIQWRAVDDERTQQQVAAGAMMADFVASIREPGRRPRVTAEDGRAALELALTAARIASGLSG